MRKSKIIASISNMVFDKIVANKRLKEDIECVDRCKRYYDDDNTHYPAATDGIDEKGTSTSKNILETLRKIVTISYYQHSSIIIKSINSRTTNVLFFLMKMSKTMQECKGKFLWVGCWDFFKGRANDNGATMWWNGVLKHFTPPDRLTVGIAFCVPGKYTK